MARDAIEQHRRARPRPASLGPEPNQKVGQRPPTPARIGRQHEADGQLLGATAAPQLDPVGAESLKAAG